MTCPAKTPVSLLQEIYVKKGVTPKYDLVQIEGAVHEPTFKYRVTVGDYVATGSGQSKKKAKHTAASAVLDKIRAVDKTEQVSVSGGGGGGGGEVLSPYDDGIEGNPVGELQELCINRRIQPPNYQLSQEAGQPHERKFVMTCVVGNQTELGSGKSKKLAKRQAANKMVARLKSQPAVTTSTQYQPVDEDELAQGIATLKREGRMFNCLSLSLGPKLKALQDIEPELEKEPEQKLIDIAEEQNIKLTYDELQERSKLNEAYCLVQLSTQPVAVCFGKGETKEEAKTTATINALLYIKVMTKHIIK